MFDLSVIANTANNDNLWCLYQGTTAEEKIIFDLFAPFLILLFLFIMYLNSKCCKKDEF